MKVYSTRLNRAVFVIFEVKWIAYLLERSHTWSVSLAMVLESVSNGHGVRWSLLHKHIQCYCRLCDLCRVGMLERGSEMTETDAALKCSPKAPAQKVGNYKWFFSQ